MAAACVPPSKKRGLLLPVSHLRTFARSFLECALPLPPLLTHYFCHLQDIRAEVVQLVSQALDFAGLGTSQQA
jgi:hypothetical protein